MKPYLLLGLAWFVVPLGVAAQSSSATQWTFFTVPAPHSCAVAFQARHSADGNVIKTGKGHPTGMGQALHLTFTSPDTRVLTKVTLSITGWTGNARVQPAARRALSREPASQAVRRLDVPLTAGAGQTATATIWVPGVTAVDAIDLVSASFADGSTWMAPANQCSIKPDPIMLVATP